MTHKAMATIVTGLRNRDLQTLIAMANAEDRARLDKAHRAYVLHTGGCPCHHFSCAKMLATKSAGGESRDACPACHDTRLNARELPCLKC
jgi:hypothetical protein